MYNHPIRGKFAVTSMHLLKWMHKQGIRGIVGYNEKFKGGMLYAEVDDPKDIARMPRRYEGLNVSTKLKTAQEHM